MNFIFISPHFPVNYWNFCRKLKENGINVLGIGDAAYDSLSYSLRDTLTEYYKVGSMEDYDQMVRAVAYFTFKYGKIDWLESNNSHWLEQDARLRTDFHITTGCDLEQLRSWQAKDSMEQHCQKAGIPAVGRQTDGITGTVCSYDAIINSKGEPLFESGNVIPGSGTDSGHAAEPCCYVPKELPKDVAEAGRRCVEAFGIRSRFIHLEFIRLDHDIPGLGKAKTLAVREVNLCPRGGFTPDMLNYANSTDVYKIWADMAAFDQRLVAERPDRYYCICIGRRDNRTYAHSHEDVLSRYRADITMSDRMPDVLAAEMGNQMYIAKFEEKEQMDQFIDYVIK
ncbi:MAG: carbamoylphosphate synthase large subunit [Lachnospiraceae bacterium]|nr:carbamoylphosphate synthase large subunit [Lachnospiraceae bacterium]